MEFNEFSWLEKEISSVGLVTIDELDNKSNRTLLYGYNCDRSTMHTYIKDGEIRTVIYGGYESLAIGVVNIDSNEDYTPDKRLYPEKCDYEFCSLLTSKRVYLPFTTFNHNKSEKKYYGETI